MSVTVIGPVIDYYVNCIRCNVRLRFQHNDILVRQVFNEDMSIKSKEWIVVCSLCKGTVKVNG